MANQDGRFTHSLDQSFKRCFSVWSIRRSRWMRSGSFRKETFHPDFDQKPEIFSIRLSICALRDFSGNGCSALDKGGHLRIEFLDGKL